MGLSLPIKGGRGTLSDTTDSFGKKNEVMQTLKIPRVRAILSNDKRNDQGRTWYLSHKEKKTWEKSML